MLALALFLIASDAPAPQQRMVVPGPITRAEADANIAARFAALDRGHDGAIDMAEARQGAQAMAAQASADAAANPGRRMVSDIPGSGTDSDWFAPVDVDHDGRVTFAEFAAGPRANFTRLDIDHDGVLSVAERTAGAERR